VNNLALLAKDPDTFTIGMVIGGIILLFIGGIAMIVFLSFARSITR
jgi:hypothetical protein